MYEQVAPEQRAMLRDLLLRLVTPTPEGEPVRSRVPLRMVAASPDHERLIGLLVNARLVTSDEGALELSHEALTRAWPRLQTWLDDDVQGQRILRHVSVAADTWDGMGRPDSELYRGTRLAQASQWQQTTNPDLNATERDFLTASRRLAEAEQQSAEERARRQTRVNRRLRGLLAGVGVLLVCALVAGLVAVREADRADEAVVAADARRVGAQALVTEDPDESLLLAVEGVRLHDSQDTRANLLAAMSKTPALIATIRSDTALISTAVSPDNRMVAVTHAWADVEFFTIDTKESLGRYDELTAAARVAFHPDGKQLAVGSQPNPAEPSARDLLPLRLVDPATRAELPDQLGGHPEQTFTLAPDYSADGRFLAGSFETFPPGTPYFGPAEPSSRVAVWDVTKPEQPVVSIDLPGSDFYPALSPDGSVIYVGHEDPPSLTAYDVASGRELMSSTLPGWILTLSPDGTVLAAADGAEISLIDAATLQERIRLRRHTGNVRDVEFSADSALLASGADDNTALVWDVASGEIRQELNGHSGSIWGLAFTSDGSLVTSSLDETVHFWDIAGTRRFIPRSPSVEPILGAQGQTFPSNAAIANARLEMPGAPGQLATAVIFRDVATGQVTPLDTRHGSWGWFTWRPDGRRFATTGADQFVRVWDWPSLELVAEQRVLEDHAVAIDFTGNGSRLVLAEGAGRVFTLDAESLEPAGPTIRLGTGLSTMKASPDNRTAIVFTSGYDYILVDLDQGRVLRRGEIDFGQFPGGYGEFSPDGRRVAVVQSRRVRVLNVATGDWLGPPVPAHVQSISYAPDGSTFATGGGDGAVSLWDGNTGSLLGTVVPGAFEPDLWAHFLPDGHTVLIASFGGDVYTWDTRPTHWVDFACQVVGRNLTTEEWNAVFDDRPYRKTCPDN